MIAHRFKVLAEPLRLKIIHALWDGELTVSEIVAATGGLQANVSKHLGILHNAGLVRCRREGVNRFYSVYDETIFDLCELVCASLHDRLAAQIDELSPAVPERQRA